MSAGDRSQLPLEGLRVLELGHIVAGPSASLLLAELGADVIKVENPKGGDHSRSTPNKGSAFFAYNRNKRSVALDLKAPEGREVFTRLLRTADVMVDNFAPGVLDRLGFGYE
ncbi:MAG TPA: CoA transferase, partial [Chloroflexota bacterium]